jgi:hypothetical protein
MEHQQNIGDGQHNKAGAAPVLTPRPAAGMFRIVVKTDDAELTSSPQTYWATLMLLKWINNLDGSDGDCPIRYVRIVPVAVDYPYGANGPNN